MRSLKSLMVPFLGITLAAQLGFGQSAPTWSSEVQLTNLGTSQDSGLAASGTNVYFATGNPDSLLATNLSTDEGTSSLGTFSLATPASMYPEQPMVADGSNVYATYFKNFRTVTDFFGPRIVGDIYLRRSSDGRNWTSEQQLTTAHISNSSGNAIFPQPAVSQNYVHVIWRDDRTTSGNMQIWYRRGLIP